MPQEAALETRWTQAEILPAGVFAPVVRGADVDDEHEGLANVNLRRLAMLLSCYCLVPLFWLVLVSGLASIISTRETQVAAESMFFG